MESFATNSSGMLYAANGFGLSLPITILARVPLCLYRLEDGVFGRPSTPKPFPDNMLADIGNFGPLSNSFLFRATGDVAISSPVPALLFCRRPTAIPRLVVAVVIDTVDAVLAGWARPHVGDKICNVSPSLTDGDSTTTIVVIAFVEKVVAASKYFSPNKILVAIIQPMTPQKFRACFGASASATFCVPGGKIASLDNQNGTALTSATPVGSRTLAVCSQFFVGKRSNSEKSECFAG